MGSLVNNFDLLIMPYVSKVTEFNIFELHLSWGIKIPSVIFFFSEFNEILWFVWIFAESAEFYEIYEHLWNQWISWL